MNFIALKLNHQIRQYGLLKIQQNMYDKRGTYNMKNSNINYFDLDIIINILMVILKSIYFL